MFDKETVEIYKSIKAPERLKLRVEELAKALPESKVHNKKLVFRLNNNYARLVTTAVAAVFCVVIGLASARFMPESINVTVSGEPPGSTYVQIMPESGGFALARSVQPEIALLSDDGENLNIEIFVDAENDANISVTKGCLILPEESGDGYGTFTLEKASMLLWNIEGILPEESARLIINGKRHEKVYILSNVDGIWTLRLEQ